MAFVRTTRWRNSAKRTWDSPASCNDRAGEGTECRIALPQQTRAPKALVSDAAPAVRASVGHSFSIDRSRRPPCGGLRVEWTVTFTAAYNIVRMRRSLDLNARFDYKHSQTLTTVIGSNSASWSFTSHRLPEAPTVGSCARTSPGRGMRYASSRAPN